MKVFALMKNLIIYIQINVQEGIYQNGYKYLTKFEKEYFPSFTFEAGGVKIEKTIAMKHGENTVIVVYKIKNKNANTSFSITPLFNFRDFHKTSTNKEFNIKQTKTKNKVKIILDNNQKYPIYMNLSEGNYHIDEKNFYNMYYKKEEERGFICEENHAISGTYVVDILPNEEKEITFVCSLNENIENIKASKLLKQEIERIDKIIDNSGLIKKNQNKEYKDLVRDYIIASDCFVVKREKYKLTTLIAGYPWFLDWGRDTLLSLEGILLIPKRYEEAKEVLLMITKDIKQGLVPNAYSEYDGKPLYNSADSSLLLFEAVYKYLQYTKDYDFIKEEIYPKLTQIISNYKSRIDLDENNIFMDEDYLIFSGTEKIQNTWMDAKVDGKVITPRNGKVVEINSLWYNALKIMSNLAKKFGNNEKSKEYEKIAQKVQESFINKFYIPRKKCLYDVIGDSKIRPNQLFALCLSYPVIEPSSKIAMDIFNVVTKKLVTPYGLRTLAKKEDGYVDIYEGDYKKRDSAYHQGITWPWLFGIYYDALKNLKKSENEETKKELEKCLVDFRVQTAKNFIKEMKTRSTVGNISEIYDSTKPFEAKGAFAQCFSVAQIYKIILEK